MQFRTIIGSLVFALCTASALPAQEPPQPPAEAAKPPAAAAPAQPAPAQATPPQAAPEKLTLKEGSDVNLKFAQDISSKTAVEGDSVNLVLDQDLKIGDVVVCKAGAKAVGTVTHAKKAGMMGHAGELSMRLEYLLMGDTRLKLRGTKGKEGQGKEGTAVTLTVLFGPIGLIKKGKNVEIKQGSPQVAYTDENYVVPPPK